MAGPYYLGVKRAGNIRRDDEVPLLVYSFHTAFSEAGLVRIPRAQVNLAPPIALRFEHAILRFMPMSLNFLGRL